MPISEIIMLIAALVNASRDIMLNVGQLTELFKKMNDEGRATLMPEEETQLVTLRDQARSALQTAIMNAPNNAKENV